MHSYDAIGRLGALCAVLLASQVFLVSCRDGAQVDAIHLNPRPPVSPGDEIQISLQMRYPPRDAVYRWRARSGILEPQESTKVSTIYKARRSGTDAVVLEVLSSGAVLLEKTFEIEVSDFRPPPAERVAEETAAASTRPLIRITQIPPYDERGGGVSRNAVGGTVTAAEPRHRVVFYACTDACYVQPLVAAPYTEIGSRGEWSNWTHTGRFYVALLVDETFKAEPVITGPSVPLEGVVARTVVEGSR